MCGITITSCSGKINSNPRVFPLDLEKKIKKIIKFNDHKQINKLFELSSRYKSDVNFLQYFKYSDERKKIKLCKNLLIKYLKKNSHRNRDNKNLEHVEKIQDIIWFLDTELTKRYQFVKKFIKKDNYTDQFLIFLKTLNSVINSINYLEIRGRDSLGLMLNISLKKNKKNIFLIKRKFNYKNNFIKIKKNFILINIIYKTCNIFGSLGDNSKEIIKKIINDYPILKLLKTGNYENINIIAHTRWASVGKVNIENTHPIANVNSRSNKLPTIFSVMNGDIYNYENIISRSRKLKNVQYNNNKSNDALALSYLFTDNLIFNDMKKIKKRLSEIEGSFVGAVISDEEISKILIIKRGNLGLYYGKNYDREFFSSDLYGLVEECMHFYEFKKNTFSIFGDKKPIHTIKKNKKLKKINITSRDISKKNYSYYLEKEINEAPKIINKTILNYIDINNVLSKKRNFFVDKEFSKFNPIIKKIKNGKINKIFITGMGTCHTAAEAIAYYMRKNFYLLFPEITVSAVIASEASAFHLENNMNKTLVIAIAQSGTTKDTNTYVEMAKNRGAHTMAILNKRSGDISYIVDEVLYLGNGRDIEIAVPSTKTYHCHLILGYIFTLYIIFKTSNDLNKIKKKLKEVLKIPKIISLTLKKNKVENLNDLYKKFSNSKNWYCLYDEESKKYASMEIRIKLSECCYKTLPFMNVKNFIENEIENSLIIYDVGLETNKLEYVISQVVKKKNYVILIGDQKKLKKIKKGKYIYKISYPRTFKYFSIISSVLIGQLLSFNVAKFLDHRGDFFKKLSKDLLKNKKTRFIKKFLSRKYDEGFLVNYPKDEILALKKNMRKYFLIKNNKIVNFIGQINYFEQYSRRPIDTIKHQAKTITVGTERKKVLNANIEISRKIKNSKFKNKTNNFTNFNFKGKKVNKFINEIKKRLKSNNNLKFIGGDANFTAAQYLANKVSKSLNISCTFDSLENHKHIDMSAEPNLIVLIANIYDSGYLSDAYAEIDKFISHNNFPFIVTNNADNKYFNKLKTSQIIQIPHITKEISLVFYLKLFERLYK